MANDRLARARNVWVATVRPDGRPHLVPIWFVVAQDRWYFATAPDSVKAANLGANPRIALALEDGNDPYIVEGLARPVEPSDEVLRLFKEKYDWDLTGESEYTTVFEVRVGKQVMGKV